MEQLLSLKEITKSFFGVQVLKSVDFDLVKGEVHVLLGENGAGKSTLIKVISGAYRPDSGAMALGGKPVNLTGYTPRTAENCGIVTIYQNFHLIPHLTVAENLAMRGFSTQRGLFIDWRAVQANARAVLSQLNFAIDPQARVKDLSVAQKQMLEIAIALSKEARAIIMDEPTAALSRKETETLFSAIAEIKKKGIGIIYISHKLDEIKQIGDRVTVLRDGSRIATLPVKDADLDQIIGLMIGKEIRAEQQHHELPEGRTVLVAQGLRNRRLDRPISLTLKQNEILGVTGLVGSGKTELARAIFGVDRLSDGTILLGGNQVNIKNPCDAVRLGVGYLPEDRDSHGLCLNMGVKENITLARLAKTRRNLLNLVAERAVVGNLVRSMDIKSTGLSQQVKYLSGGNKQKVVFGKWLRADCRVLLLDEPTIGIDVGARQEIYDLVRQFVDEPGKSVIFISSDIGEVLQIADRIIVMAGHDIVAELDPETTTKQEIMQYCLRASANPLAPGGVTVSSCGQ